MLGYTEAIKSSILTSKALCSVTVDQPTGSQSREDLDQYSDGGKPEDAGDQIIRPQSTQLDACQSREKAMSMVREGNSAFDKDI